MDCSLVRSIPFHFLPIFSQHSFASTPQMLFLVPLPKQDDEDVATSGVARAASPSEKDTVGGRSSFESFASVESPKKAGSKTTGLPMEQGTQSDDEDPNVQAAIATSLAAQVIAGAANAPDQSTAGYSSGSSIASLAEEKGTKTAGLSSSDDEEESESSEDSTKVHVDSLIFLLFSFCPSFI